MDILVLGPQGSGKGTQAKLISKTYGIPHVATGDMIREIKELDTPLGRELKAVYDAGDLVNDDLMVRLISDRLGRGDTIPGVILDGFPRTMQQADSLDELLAKLGRSIDVVLVLQVPDRETLLERMLKRAEEEKRSDDTPEAIEHRLETYERETAPLVEHYRAKQANVVGIHANRPIEDVFAEIRDALEQVAARVVGSTEARKRAEVPASPAPERGGAPSSA
jgi:adenylate kinase